jgi:hypothetical protein
LSPAIRASLDQTKDVNAATTGVKTLLPGMTTI